MKYQGNKTKIVKDILPIMLSEMSEERKCFVDAFCGSCSVVSEVPDKYVRIANDINPYLIAMWQSLMLNDIVENNIFPSYIDKALYVLARNCFNDKNGMYSDAMVGWIGYMASFNGRFFSGGYSGHDVVIKDGTERDYITENINNITKQLETHNFDGIEFTNHSYDKIPLTENSLIYCDIPYKDTKQYEYSKDFDYEKFYAWCKEKTAEGHKVFISEYWMPSDFKCVWEKEVTVAMNQTITKKPVEKLYTL